MVIEWNETLVMTRYNYPRIDEQRKEHDNFTRDAEELVERIEDKGLSAKWLLP